MMLEYLERLGERLVQSGDDESDPSAPRVRTDGGRPEREGRVAGSQLEGPTESTSRTTPTGRRGRLTDRLRKMLSSAFRTGSPEPVPPTERPPSAYLDHTGAFCESSFERKTGRTTSAFVVEYVEEHGGAVRQQAIVRCLPWSDSKVSRLLAELEHDGRLVRQSIGRENAVFLPDAVPDGS